MIIFLFSGSNSTTFCKQIIHIDQFVALKQEKLHYYSCVLLKSQIFLNCAKENDFQQDLMLLCHI